MFFFLQRWNGDGFWKFSPSPLMEWYLLNHWQRWFFNGFSNFEDQWFTMVTRFSQKKKFMTKCAFMKIYLKPNMAWNLQQSTTSTQVDINQGTSGSRHRKNIFSIFQKLSLVCLIFASASKVNLKMMPRMSLILKVHRTNSSYPIELMLATKNSG